MTYVRWGATKFVRGQARFGGDNEYDAAAEPSDTDWALALHSSDPKAETTKLLLNMIKPAFPANFSPSNVGAMMKRCNVALNTPKSVFFRPAGVSEAVQKLPLLDGYIVSSAGIALR